MSAGKTESRADSGSTRSALSPQAKKKERPPFKLCFVKQQESGRSNVSICKTTANVLTPKFYSRDAEPCDSPEISQTVAKITEEEQRVPKTVHRWPLLTSHTYGWWHDRGIQPTDPRFNFHKKTSDMVSYQMRIYAVDRKLKGLGY
ncbi:uncharacterized protein [Neodiprion pinetum]|uniref:uncharacterized protein LOC124181433 n=1 Tax=Neodiprion fabricii TaxID=2872261 RepID=UPI001ED97B5D|nr:uncharacterized protein LOC124181433 [Neodiprion fabricii]XP_046479900.1 uncharacterized protein LOC124217840 [Neodiprion pinetum]XP_046614662.1 uncharacterized protein LOC124302476 [Neodiprion virginianus]